MADHGQIGKALQMGLVLVYISYIMISNGIRAIFSPSYTFHGDVLQALPRGPVGLTVRLLMTFVVMVSAPLVVVPCGEMIEGKLGLEPATLFQRMAIRCTFCALCTALSEILGAG